MERGFLLIRLIFTVRILYWISTTYFIYLSMNDKTSINSFILIYWLIYWLE